MIRFLVVLCVVVAFWHATAMANGLRIIASPNPEVRLGQDMIVSIYLKNISNQRSVVSVSRTPQSAEIDYKICLYDFRGHPIPFTPYGRAVYAGSESITLVNSMFLKTLLPGDALEEQVNLNKVFDINHPGIYKMTIERSVNSANGPKNELPVKPEPVYITVHEK
jgi:hypothetical protein